MKGRYEVSEWVDGNTGRRRTTFCCPESDEMTVDAWDGCTVTLRRKQRPHRRWSWVGFVNWFVPALIGGTAAVMGFTLALLMATGAI